MFNSFLYGLTLPLRAVLLILKNRAVLSWAIVPPFISVIIYIILWGTLLSPTRESILVFCQNWFSGIFGKDSFSQLQNIALVIVSIVVNLAFFLVMLLSFAGFSTIVSLPFNDILAQKVELALNPPLKQQQISWLESCKLLFIDFKKSLISIFGLIICLSVSWVPIMNIFALILTWILLVFQYVSFPQTRRSIGTRKGISQILQDFPACLGLGMALSIGFALPILTIFVPTIAVVSGTMLYASRMHLE